MLVALGIASGIRGMRSLALCSQGYATYSGFDESAGDCDLEEGGRGASGWLSVRAAAGVRRGWGNARLISCSHLVTSMFWAKRKKSMGCMSASVSVV